MPEFNFFVQPYVLPEPDDVLIGLPVYYFPALMFERRKMSPSKYFRRIIVVDGMDGSAKLTRENKLPVMTEIDYSTKFCFRPKISYDIAHCLAEYGTIAYEERKYMTRIVKNWKMFVNRQNSELLYHAYLLRGNAFIDCMTGNTVVNDRIPLISEGIKSLL